MSSKKTIPCSNYQNPLCILYGSATGNSEQIAKDLTKHIQSDLSMLHPTFDQVVCCELDQYKKVGCLQLWEQDLDNDDTPYQYRGVLIICSTTGNGDPPENASRFVRHMKKAATAETHNNNNNNSSNNDATTKPSSLLFRNVCYAVLGLGDTNYDQFCAAAVTIDRAIHQLGGHKCILYDTKHSALTTADEGSGQLEDVVEPWVSKIVPKIVQACRRPSPSVTSVNGGDAIPADAVDPAEEKNSDTSSSDVKNIVTVVVQNEEASAVQVLPKMSNGDVTVDATMSTTGTRTKADPLIAEKLIMETPAPSTFGVQMIQAILSQQQQDPTDIDVDPSTLPASLLIHDDEMTSDTTFTKPFTHIAATETATIDENTVYSESNNDNIQQRVRGLSIGSHAASNNNVIDDTVSSVSAGYYYTAHNPYPAQILKARYLTNTSTEAAQQVVALISNQPQKQQMNDISSLYKEAECIYDTAFPLTLSPSSSSTIHDTETIDRNGKRVIEMTLSLPDDSTLEYSPGDSLGVLVDNPVSLVEYVAHLLLQNDPSIHDPFHQMIQINHDHVTHQGSTSKPISVMDAISRHLDLCSTIKNKRILFSLSQLATDSLQQKYLLLLSSKTTRGELLFRSVVDEQRMNIVDVIQQFPSVQSKITLEVMFQIAPNSIPPRYYSVSSSPLQPLHARNSSNTTMNGPSKEHTNYLTVAFSVVDYITPAMDIDSTTNTLGQRRIKGVATRYLETVSSSLLCGKEISKPLPTLRIFPKPTIDFRMPHSLSTPLILIGPGTGIAPFVGFLRHRQALCRQQSNVIRANSDMNDSEGMYSTTMAAKTIVEGTWRGGYELQNDNELAITQQDESGLNVGADYRIQSNHSLDYGSVDVLFGCRHEKHDWLYGDEMNEFLQEGIISKLYTAFSRDTPTETNTRRYVQDFILADDCGKRFVDLIVNHDAAVYVCGDGNSMAQDVQSAFITLFASTQFNGNREMGKTFLEDMKRKQRFLMDIWS